MNIASSTISAGKTSSPSRDISVLNARELDHSPKTWGDALNQAIDAQDQARGAGVAAKSLTEAQKSQMHAGLNDRRQVRHPTADLADRKLVSSHTPSPVTSPDAPPFVDVAGKDALNARAGAKSTDTIEKTAQTLVNQFFMGTMLKQMRESPFKDQTFSGGRAGEAYAGLFDQHVAEHAGNKIAKSLVASMVRQYQKNPSSISTSATPVIRHESALAITA